MFENVFKLPWLSYPTCVWEGIRFVSDKGAYTFGVLLLAVTVVAAWGMLVTDVMVAFSLGNDIDWDIDLYDSILVHMFNIVFSDVSLSPNDGIDGKRSPRLATRGGLGGGSSSSSGVQHLSGAASNLFCWSIDGDSDHGRNGVNPIRSAPFSPGSLSG